jgi:uncharacterized Zn-binding protein involved in type VI secretion
MGKPIARQGDMHTCPMIEVLTPHVGGPINGPCAPTVLAENMPVAVIGDSATCAGTLDSIVVGAPLVFAENKPVACVGSTTTHGGVIISGCPTVLVGCPEPPQVVGLRQCADNDRPICEDCTANNDQEQNL